MTQPTSATAEIEKWLRVRVRFFTNYWLRVRVQKKNGESCRSRIRHSGYGAISEPHVRAGCTTDWAGRLH